jgi:tetratricopeptide (TPR) repeat protein
MIMPNLRNSIRSKMGLSLQGPSERNEAAGDLDTAIANLRQTVQATPADHPQRAARLSDLGNALQGRYERAGTAGDLDEAIAAGHAAVQFSSGDHPERMVYLSNLGNALRLRSGRSGAAGDLDAAITLFQQAEQATPANHPNLFMILSNLGISLLARFERSGAAGDLDAAIDIGRQAVLAAPASHPNRAAIVANLGTALLTRFRRTGSIGDLDAGIACYRQVQQADHPGRAAIISNLGNALQDRYEHTGAPDDLDAAITHFRHAEQALPADHPSRAAIMSNLGSTLRAKFEHAGKAGDLDAAIDVGQEAVKITPASHPDRAIRLMNLGNALRLRFLRTGTAGDLDAAINCFRQSVRATPKDHTELAWRLSNLGGALHARYIRDHAADDLGTAIAAMREAVQATPLGHPRRAVVQSHLGILLEARYERDGAASDLDETIEVGEQAAQASTASRPDHAVILCNLGNALVTRYERAGAAGDLDSAINCYQQSVAATPADHVDRSSRLSNLGMGLTTRYRRTGIVSDLDAAIEAGRQAVQTIPADDTSRAMIMSNLGSMLKDRFERTRVAADQEAAFQMYAQAARAPGAAASERIAAGRFGARLAEKDPGRAASLLEEAVLLLPEITPRFLERGDQQHAISRVSGLAAEAAAAALSDPAVPERHRPARALRLLEAARGLLLTQALSTRGDLSQLHERHPELAARFTQLRDWLDRPSTTISGDLARLLGEGAAAVGQQTIPDRRAAHAEFTHLLTRIRATDGFRTFALPPPVTQLTEQASQGPVVVFNVSASRSDAILVTSDGITSVPLPGLGYATVARQVRVFSRALETVSPLESDWDRTQQAIQQVLSWLWDSACEPVLDVLGYRAPPTAGQPWPRLWWVPSGPLSLLPIHAAGHHSNPPEPGGRSVLDRVISSYTPTIGALVHARAVPAPAVPISSLVVAMPTTPGMRHEGRLDNVRAEASMLQDLLPSPLVLTEPSPADDTSASQLPSKATVLGFLSRCSIAHFACHGYNDPADPSQSRLLLHDHEQDPLTVAALAPVALDHAQLAYLSACSTARATNSQLLDEAIHLASAFQMAGFPHVIGTLWELNDKIAVEIARTLYNAITKPDGTLDADHAAEALHHAIRAQRELYPDTPYLWASHIHAGA